LMELPDLTPERRTQLGNEAHRRMLDSATELDRALGETNDAVEGRGIAAMERASARLNEAHRAFDSAIATHRALAENRAPRRLALDWLKREMNLTVDPHDRVAAAGPFGMSPAHLASMGLLTGFVLLALGMHVERTRRVRALIATLRTDGTPAAIPVPPPVAAAPGGAGPAVERVPATPTGNWAGKLRVARIFQETPTVKTFRLAPTAGEVGAALPFLFEPGQFLTIAVDVDGKSHKRSYSIASSPCCVGWCEITVKQEPGGIVSGRLHDHTKEGDLVDASGPYGRFTFRGHEAPSVVFIAGGVGITPLMSAIRFLTDESWNGRIDLLYGATRWDTVIFKDELEQLSRRHPNLHVTFVLSEEPSQAWTGARGFITADVLRTLPDLRSRRIHLCGPPRMMESVKSSLASLGVADTSIRTELFLSAAASPAGPSSTAAAVAAGVTCSFVRSGKQASMAGGRTVLEAAESAGVRIEYACRQGFCGVCRVKLVNGHVTMAVEDGLSAADRAAGLILACQAKASGDLAVDA
jgi:ferredoxin-NADP reductase